MTDTPDFDAEKATRLAELAELDRQIAISRTSLETGVPQGFLQNGQSAEEIAQIAADAISWRAAEKPSAPPPAPSARPAYSSVNGVSQFSKDALKYLTPQQINAACAENRLSAIGAPRPEPRRTGEQHRNAAP